MRPFESLASLGAKWCLVNRLSANEFKKWMDELTQRAQSRPRADGRTWHDVEAESLAKAFGEPVAVTRTVRSGLKIEASNFGSEALQQGGPAGGFRFCRECLKEGFHSDLHEVSWLRFCFVHPDTELVCGVEALDQAAEHPLKEPHSSLLGRVRFLMQLWGGPRSVFPLPAAWMWRKETLKSESSRWARGLIADITAVTAQERGAPTNDAVDLRWPPLVWATGMESVAPRLRYWLNRQPKWLQLVGGSERTPLSMKSPRRVARQSFYATSDEKLIALDRLSVVELRVNEVFESDLWPAWRRLYDQIAQGLVSGHRGCQAIYDEACRPLMPRLTWGESTAQRAHRIAHLPALGCLACQNVQLAAVWHDLFVHIQSAMPLNGARADSETLSRIRAQHSFVQLREHALGVRVDAADLAAIQTLLGYRVPVPVPADAPCLADAVIYEIVLAAAWAIDCMIGEHTAEGEDAEEKIAFEERFRALHPLVVLSPREEGIDLNMTAYVPSRLPRWASRFGSASDPAHLLIVANDAERIATSLRSRR